MNKKEVRRDDLQSGTVLIREQLAAESPPTLYSSIPAEAILIHSPKLLPHRQECTVQPRQECPSAETFPMHLLQHCRDEEKVPMFLVKMWNILEDPEFQNIICWDKV